MKIIQVNSELLIAAVKERPAIWRTKNPKYKNKLLKTRMWKEVQDLFPEISLNVLQRKWKNLKDTYRREVKKVPDPLSNHSGEEGQSSWHYFSLLSFLKGELSYRTDSLLQETEETQEMLIGENSSDTLDLPSAACTDITDENLSENCFTDVKEEVLETESSTSALQIKEVSGAVSEDYCYLMSLLPHMEKLSPIQKLRVRNEFNNILLQEMNC